MFFNIVLYFLLSIFGSLIDLRIVLIPKPCTVITSMDFLCGTLSLNSFAILLLNAINNTVLSSGINFNASNNVVVLPLPATAEITAFFSPFKMNLKISFCSLLGVNLLIFIIFRLTYLCLKLEVSLLVSLLSHYIHPVFA